MSRVAEVHLLVAPGTEGDEVLLRVGTEPAAGLDVVDLEMG